MAGKGKTTSTLCTENQGVKKKGRSRLGVSAYDVVFGREPWKGVKKRGDQRKDRKGAFLPEGGSSRLYGTSAASCSKKEGSKGT